MELSKAIESDTFDKKDIPTDPLREIQEKVEKEGATIGDLFEAFKDNGQTQEEAQLIVATLIQDGLLETEQKIIDENTEIKKINIDTLIDEVENFAVDRDFVDDTSIAAQASYFADWLIDQKGIKPVEIGRQSQKRVQIWAYFPEEGVWQNNGDRKSKRLAKQQLPRKVFKNRFLKELNNNLENSIPKDFEELGLKKGLIAAQNGVINIEDFEVRPIEKEDYVLNKIAASFNKPELLVDDFEELGCPKFGEFLKDSVPKDKQRKKLQEYVGYSLMHWTTKHEKALMLLGPTDSGKGVFLKVVEHILGEDNVCSYDLQYLSNKMWGRQDLATNMANIRHDLDTDKISKMGKAKEIISGDPIMAAKKRQDPIKIQPKAKHFYSANNPPERKIEDDAFYNRWLTVIFPNTVPVEKQDKKLVEKITGKTKSGEPSEDYEGELEGLLNWALAGLKRLKANNGRFTGSISSEATRQLWQEYGNSVSNFKDEFMVKEEGAKIPTTAAYEAYKLFAQVEGFEVESRNGFTQTINSDKEIRKGARKIDGSKWCSFDGIEYGDSSKQCFVGVRLKSGAIDELRDLAGLDPEEEESSEDEGEKSKEEVSDSEEKDEEDDTSSSSEDSDSDVIFSE